MLHYRYACLPLLLLVACSAGEPSDETPDETASHAEALAAAFPPPLTCPVRTVGVVPADADGAWTVETVAERAELASTERGSGVSVAVESTGRVHVGWYTNERICWSGPTGMYDIGAFMHAYRNGDATTWTKATVNCKYNRGMWPVMSVDAQDRVHAVYGSGASNSSSQFGWYSLWNGSQWEGHSVVGGNYLGDHPVAVVPDCTNSPLVLTNGEVHTRDGTSFHGENVPFEDASHVHAARDASGKLHVAADVMVPTGPSTAEGRARYAVFNGTSWKKEDPSAGARSVLVGMQVDSTGRPHVVYRVRRGDDIQLWHAVRGTLTWSRERIPVDSTVAESFTIAGNDELFVMAGNNIARKSGSRWAAHSVSELLGAEYPTITVDAAGQLHAVFYQTAPYDRASVHHAVFAHR